MLFDNKAPHTINPSIPPPELFREALSVTEGQSTVIVIFDREGHYSTTLNTTGLWKWFDGRLCLTSNGWSIESGCYDMTFRKIGDRWTVSSTADEGQLLVTLVAPPQLQQMDNAKH